MSISATSTRKTDARHLHAAGTPVSGRMLTVLLFALAWFQLAYATHQFEHVAGDVAGSCHACSQLERLDTAIAQDEPRPDRNAPALPADTSSEHLQTPARFRNHHSRAPPAV